MYGTSHKRPFVPSVGITDYYVIHRQRVSLVKHLQMLPTGLLIPLDVDFCERFVVRGRESKSPQLHCQCLIQISIQYMFPQIFTNIGVNRYV